MLTVVAALIESEGKLLVCQRRRGDTFELLWEFPGGKRRAGEKLEEALARELREELGVTARIGAEMYRTRHRYRGMAEGIELVFFAASVERGEVRNLVFERIAWREPRRLRSVDFLAADKKLIEKLARGAMRLPGGGKGKMPR
ncbi:MAG: NUDIX domain-containing protein [Candidatus Acidiferrales bacterium]